MIPESHRLAVECMEIAIQALEEVVELASHGALSDCDMIQCKAIGALNEIKRKQALRV